MMPIQGKAHDGEIQDAFLLDAGPEAPEIELLRTIARELGVSWGHDEFGWWAAVPKSPRSGFTTRFNQSFIYALYREDDNGGKFLIQNYDSQVEAEQMASELTRRGHKQHYYVEVVSKES